MFAVTNVRSRRAMGRLVVRPLAIGLLAILLAWPLGHLTAAEAPAVPKPADAVATITASGNLEQFRLLEQRIQQVVAQVLPATVAIRVGSIQGTGVIVTRDGYVATAGHLIDKPGEAATFITPDGKNHKGITLGLDRAADSGLMKITDAGPWPFVEMGQSRGLPEGTWCIVIGHPLGYQEGRPPVVRVGRILSVQEATLRTDCSIVSGDSGGPLLSLDAKVIGIQSRIGNLTSMNYHVPIDSFRENWTRLAASQTLHVDLLGKDCREVKRVFRQVVKEANRCTVRVKADGRDVALGTIVAPQGWILTKASEVKGKIVCRTKDGHEYEARLAGVSTDFDLAMLKIEASGLPSIPWSDETPSVGQWVTSAGLDDDPLALGVMSVPQRRIPPPSGALGVTINDDKAGSKIIAVTPNSPAERIGLRVDDVITHFNGKAMPNRSALIAAVRSFRPGDQVKLTVQRGAQKLEFSTRLAVVDTPGSKKRESQNTSGTGISSRHDNFPVVLQHDGAVRPADCGGPLVDLTGRVVGVNIARGGRTETYAVPRQRLATLIDDLMSGRLAPPMTASTAPPVPRPLLSQANTEEAKPQPKPHAASKLGDQPLQPWKPEPQKRADPAKR